VDVCVWVCVYVCVRVSASLSLFVCVCVCVCVRVCVYVRELESTNIKSSCKETQGNVPTFRPVFALKLSVFCGNPRCSFDVI
jgi:hypothetical protein